MPGISAGEARVLSLAAVEAYARDGELVEFLNETFGQWVLSTVYQKAALDLSSERDFRYAQRTEDARIYLSGMLQRGELPAEPLRQYLQAQPA